MAKVDVAQEDPDRRQRLAGGGWEPNKSDRVCRSLLDDSISYGICQSMGQGRPYLEVSGRRS